MRTGTRLVRPVLLAERTYVIEEDVEGIWRAHSVGPSP